jgi:hypothetical protein
MSASNVASGVVKQAGTLMEEAGSFNMDLDKGGRRECPSSPETLVSLVDLARKFDFLNN